MATKQRPRATRGTPLLPRDLDGPRSPRGRADGFAILRGRGVAGDSTGNSPGTKWVAFNAIAEHLDYGRRYTSRTNQVQRSFEHTAVKQRALDLVLAA
jgi:hypothetical protein